MLRVSKFVDLAEKCSNVTRWLQETHELQKKQAWYQQNQVSMQKDDEEAYLAYCSEAMFRINILELRLNRCARVWEAGSRAVVLTNNLILSISFLHVMLQPAALSVEILHVF